MANELHDWMASNNKTRIPLLTEAGMGVLRYPEDDPQGVGLAWLILEATLSTTPRKDHQKVIFSFETDQLEELIGGLRETLSKLKNA